MKDIFEQKLNNAIYFTKPVEFLEIRSGNGQVYLKSQRTYGVYYKKKKVKGVMTNVFWLQSEDNRGTHSFDWCLKASDDCMTAKEALPIAKMKRMQYSEQRLLDLERIIKLNKLYLKNSANFDATIDNERLKNKKQWSTNVGFPKLDEIRGSFNGTISAAN